MLWFRNLGIAKKLGILIMLAVIFLTVTGITSYRYLMDANNTVEDMYREKLVAVQALTENRVHQRAIQGEILELMLTKDANRNKALIDSIQERVKLYNENVSQLEKVKMDAKQKQSMQEVAAILQQYRQERESVIALSAQNKNDEAYELYVKKVFQVAEAANVRVKELADYTEKLAEQDAAQNAKNASTAIQWLIGINLFALLFTAGLGWAISRAIVNPLKEVTATANEVAAGNLTVKAIKVNSTDEVGQVAKTINQMVKNLYELIHKVSNSAEQLASSSEELTASAEQSAQASNQIAASITDVAAGTTEQMNAANETSAVVEQMSAGIQQVAANSNQVAAQSAQAADKAKEGGQSVEKAVNQMVQIEATVNTSAKMVAKLGERSKEIGQIVDTISGIAGQTNLLALNAAIEAARAGEQGRGFAVVAEEVRKLAEQSQDAAKKIAELIGEIQGDTDRAVVAMNDGTKEVKTGAEVVNAAGAAFREISDLVAQVSSQVKEISAAIQQMASGSQQIVGSVKKIDDLSKKSAGESQSVSAATEEQLASMEEIASSSQALAQLAQDLQGVVTKFRI